jgi:hypothetical protein
LECSKKVLPGLMPILEIDGTFMKHHSYNRICCEYVPIAIAFVSTETTNNFFMNFKAGGIDLENFAVFCNWGNQMPVQQYLLQFGFNWLHLKIAPYILLGMFVQSFSQMTKNGKHCH